MGRATLSLSTSAFRTGEFTSALEWAARLGLSGVEVGPAHAAELRASPEAARDTGLTFERLELRSLSLHAWRQVEGLEEVCPFAAELGAGLVVVHCPHEAIVAGLETQAAGLAFFTGQRRGLAGTVMPRSREADMAEMDTKALRNVSYGLYIVTSGDARRRNGQIANTSFQVTSQPATVAVSINKQNLTHEIIEQCQAFGVSVLEESTPMPFIGLFGFKSGRDLDKFASVQADTGATGCPLVIDHAIAVLEAKVVAKLDAGSHSVFLGELVSCRVLKQAEPLTYAKYHQNKGKEPKTAPTYSPAEPAAAGKQGTAPVNKNVCSVCGWAYDPAKGDPDAGIAPGTPFEQIPDSWVCPVCGAAKADFALQ